MNNNKAPADGIHKLPGVNQPHNPLDPIEAKQLPPGFGYPPGPNANPYISSGPGPNFTGAYVPLQNTATPVYGYGASSHGNFPPAPGYCPPQGPQVVCPAVWMPRPQVAHCPPGLEYLTQINQLLVKQQKELLEIVTSVETENRYICMNTMGQTVYSCREESDYCMRQCCKSNRAFTMHVQDNMGGEVIRVNRPYKYHYVCRCFSCAECCQDEVEVEAPVGHVIGYVKQVMAGCDVRYHVMDANRNLVLQIHGPSYCYCPCYGEDVHFRVMSADGGAEIGRITKQWSNILQELLTNADNFGVSFPIDLDVHVKATLIGAVFLIDFMFFEQNTHPRRNDD